MAVTAYSWLNGDRDYTDGLMLLTSSGASGFLIDLLCSGPDAYNTPRLQQEIERLAANEVLSEISGLSIAPIDDQLQDGKYLEDSRDAANQFTKAIGFGTADRDLEKSIGIKEKIKTLYKEVAHFKSKLAGLKTDSERYECAKELVTRDLRRQDLWEHLHYFEENGKWFDELPENQPKPVNLEQAIKNLMSNRAKAKKFLSLPQPVAKRKYYEAKIANLTAQIDKLTKQRING